MLILNSNLLQRQLIFVVQFTANLRQINACLGVDMNCVLHRATYRSRQKKRLFYGQADRKRLPCPPLTVSFL